MTANVWQQRGAWRARARARMALYRRIQGQVARRASRCGSAAMWVRAAAAGRPTGGDTWSTLAARSVSVCSGGIARADSGEAAGPVSSTGSAVPRKRMRQHVNPLLARYARPVALPELHTVFRDATKPLHVDIGCGTGAFVVAMAQVGAASRGVGPTKHRVRHGGRNALTPLCVHRRSRSSTTLASTFERSTLSAHDSSHAPSRQVRVEHRRKASRVRTTQGSHCRHLHLLFKARRTGRARAEAEM